LQEIARLIAEKDGDGADGDPAPREAAGEKGIPGGTGNALDASLLGRLFESIPAAVAILSQGKLVRANDNFAMAFGFKSAAELIEAGGMARILSEAGAELLSPAREPTGGGPGGARFTLEASTKSGRKLVVPAILHRDSSGTDLLVLRPLDGPGETPLPAPAAAAKEPPRASRETEANEPPSAEARSKAPLPANDGAIELLAKVSHEVRTPLNSIIGFAELMKEERFGPLGHAKYRSYAEDIVESGQYALGIINDLLDLSKIRTGNFELNFTAVDANDVIEDCVHLIEHQARRERVVLRVALEDGVPQILADRRSLKQILLNLLSNAVKFTAAGGQVIVSSSGEADGAVVLRVRDTGVGMSKSDIAQAMKPFQQLDTAPRQQTGTGLGLPLTKALAEANRAEMRIESARRVGTSIDIRFPPDRVLKP